MNNFAISIVEWTLQLITAYVIAGLVFSIPFVTFLIKRVDPAATGWAIGFRLIIIPGVVLFWPLFAIRLLKGKQHPTEKNAHRIAAKQAPVSGG
ncbi:hypothetical protein Lepto7376_2306 [[Leptolyngbya] sp. PCC 7376]|uniref:hypothetical protein n=1 Tax=[Leptolyngbya] sp. PCC 7376 TaxID=111781 RepID=UPI00029F017C|nr:hypothetical protein [[Leptolyngbya] sp. PCC 7376]AFY38596.1 hypothetical protein Lepto7376_2306 [[Leptolyngbya] sp. PCC 7376]